MNKYLQVVYFITLISSAVYSQTIDDKGLNIFWNITEKLEAEEAVSEKAWQSLWKSKGYNSWMASERGQNIFYNYYSLIHNPKFKDSLHAEIERSKGYRLTMFNHMIAAKEKKEILKTFTKKLKTSNILNEGKEIVKKHLPTTFNIDNDSTDIALMIFQPDAFALPEDNVIVMDALFAFKEGDRLKWLVAHELHHVYVLNHFSKLKQLDVKHTYFPLINSISKLRLEGTADLIDKTPLFTKKNKNEYETRYITYYNNSNEYLKKIDSLLIKLTEKGETHVEEYGKQIRQQVKYGGHPLGLYMAKAIKSNLSKDKLFSCLENPFTFITLYNEVARKFPDKYYVISRHSMNYLKRLEDRFVKY